MANSNGGEKTEKATPKRMQKARSEGQIGTSPEVGSWVSLLVATFLLPGLFKSLMGLATQSLVQAVAIIQHPDTGPALALAENSLRQGVVKVVPLALVIAAVAVAAHAGQGGIHVAPKLLKPKFSRLNPLHGLKRLAGPMAAWQLAKSLLKTGALALVVYLSVRHLIPTLYGAGSLPLASVVNTGVATVLNVVRYAAAAGVAMALVDYVVVRRRNSKQLKMSKEEVKEEVKSSEGDPRRKGEIRSRQVAIARNRMMKDVPKADVVIVNPTHVAVALKYEAAKGAPRVVAKGADHVAARIREVAEQNRVPMVRDVPLARTLYQTVEIGQEIPPDLYRAVATVLAFIMNLRRRGSVAGLLEVRPLSPATAFR